MVIFMPMRQKLIGILVSSALLAASSGQALAARSDLPRIQEVLASVPEPRSQDAIIEALEAAGFTVLEYSVTFFGRIVLVVSKSGDFMQVVVSSTTGEIRKFAEIDDYVPTDQATALAQQRGNAFGKDKDRGKSKGKGKGKGNK